MITSANTMDWKRMGALIALLVLLAVGCRSAESSELTTAEAEATEIAALVDDIQGTMEAQNGEGTTADAEVTAPEAGEGETAVNPPAEEDADNNAEEMAEEVEEETAVSEPDPTAEPAQEEQPAPAEPTPLPTAEPLILEPRLEETSELDFDVFYEVFAIIEQQFDGQVPENRELLYAAIIGALETLDDDFTRFVTPEVAERNRQDMGGSVEGIGAFVRENDEGLFEIVRPIDGQPADIAGLQPGDIIIGVDGESVLDLSFDEVILLVRGPRGTEVRLTVLRGEEEIDFLITRVRFEIEIIQARLLPDGIAYVRLAEFNRNAEERVVEALTELLPDAPNGVIFDLRDNPGGFLDQSVAVADIFLEEGTVLFERNIRGLDETFRSDDGDIGENIPLVVLVNAGSASASEIVAGAIQDNGRAALIGETTFGKGSVQQLHSLSDGSELRVTIARWYTPANNTIDGVGITPDIEIPTPPDLGGDSDTQLRAAVDFLLGTDTNSLLDSQN